MKISGALMVFTISRPFVYRKLGKRSPRKLKKPYFLEVLPTERARSPKIFPADLIPPARSEIFSGLKFLVRNLVRPDFFAAKVFPAKIFRLEI